MSSEILRIFYADCITEALFQITALNTTKKKALGENFFSKITKDFNSFFSFTNTAATDLILLHWHPPHNCRSLAAIHSIKWFQTVFFFNLHYFSSV